MGLSQGTLSMLLLVLALVTVSQQQAVSQTTVSNGTELAQAVALFGHTGQDTTLLLEPGHISMSNSSVGEFPTIPDGGDAFSAGHLTISAIATDPADTVLDSAMRCGLTAPFHTFATMQLEGFSAVNNCEQILSWSRKYNMSWMTSTGLALFNRSRNTQTQSTNDMVIYARHADLAVHVYFLVAQRAQFQQIRELSAPVLDEIPSLAANISVLTRTRIRFVYFNTPPARHYNLTLISTIDTQDALLQQLRARGELMAPRFCSNNSEVPAEVVNQEVDERMGPAWVATTTEEWVMQLGKISNFTQEKPLHPRRPAPALVLSGSAQLNASTPSGSLTLARHTILLGPFNDDPSTAVDGVLDLAGREGILQLAPDVQLFMMQLVLRGLATRPLTLPAIDAKNSGSNVQPSSDFADNHSTVFPLRFVTPASNLNWTKSPYIWLQNVTLALPTGDLLAMAAIVKAWRPRMTASDAAGAIKNAASCVGDRTTAHALKLLHGMTDAFHMDAANTSDPNSIWPLGFRWFVGWGVNATMLKFAPVHASDVSEMRHVISCFIPPPPPDKTLADDPSSHDHVTSAAIVGGVLGSLLLLTCVGGLIFYACRWRAKHAQQLPISQRGHLNKSSQPGSGSSALQASRASHGSSSTPRSERSSGSLVAALHLDAPRTRAQAGGDAADLSRQTCSMSQLQLVVTTAGHIVASSAVPVDAAVIADVIAQEQASVASGVLHTSSKVQMSKAVLSQAGLLQDGSQNTTTCCRAHGSGAGSSSPSREDDAEDAHSLNSDRTGDSEPHAMTSSSEEMLLTNDEAAVNDIPSSLAGEQLLRQDVELRAGQLDARAANRVVVSGVLGQGSWGKVFKGEWRGLPVALKTLLFEEEPGLSAGGMAAKAKGVTPSNRAIMEAAIAASVGHRNVVCTYHFDIVPVGTHHDDTVSGGLQIAHTGVPGDRAAYKMFLVQELCATTLSHALSLGAMHNKVTGRTEELPLMFVLLDIACGLEYLHGRGIIHGDLKPANVLLKADNSCPAGVVAKLADFGLSCQLQPGATHVSNFHSGTPFYVAPEVVHTYRTSTASDVYTFGVIMWQLYSGQTPFIVINENQYAPNPLFPNFKPPRTPGAAYMQLMRRCVARDPAIRPPTPELVQLLKQLMPPIPGTPQQPASPALPAAPAAVLEPGAAN